MIEIHRQRQQLDELFERTRELPEEFQSHWCRYLCVLVSGFLENSVERCLSEYASKRSTPYVANYVQAKLHGFQNPKMGAIIDLFGAFNPGWRHSLEAATDGQLSDSINSIVGNRHKIAHGESVSLSMSSLRNYYADAKRVVEILEATCEV